MLTKNWKTLVFIIFLLGWSPFTQALTFTQKAWKNIEPTFDQILRHPFIEELGKGSLDSNIFQFYKSQDAYYLRTFFEHIPRYLLRPKFKTTCFSLSLSQ